MMRRLLYLAVALCILLPLLGTSVTATELEEDLFADFFEALPPSVRSELEGQRDPAAAGELVGAEYVVSLLLSALQDGLPAAASLFVRLLALSLLLSVLSYLAKSLAGDAAARAAQGGIGVILAFLIFRVAGEDITRVTACLADIRAFSGGLVPVFFGLYAAGGSTATATAAASGFTALSYMLEHVCMTFLLPLLELLFAFTAIAAAGGKWQMKGVFSALRSLYISTLAFLSLLLVTSLGAQSSLAASADSLTAQSVRFVVGNLIPVVGGSLSSTLRTLGASLSLIKSTVGALSVAALLLLLLPPLLSLLLHRFCFSLCAAVADMLGAERAGKILSSFRLIYDLAAATLALVLVLFLLILALLVRCTVAIA